MLDPPSDVEPLQAKEEQGSNVGVVGWLGFVIINCAALGLVGVSWALAWVIGFILLIIYTALLFVCAVIIERQGNQFRQFVNLFWVLGCSFICVSGTVFSVQIMFGGNYYDYNPYTDGKYIDNDLCQDVLPSNASPALQAWACTTNPMDTIYPDVLAVAGRTYFAGYKEGSDILVLQYTEGSTIKAVVPELQEPYSFSEFESQLFVSAMTGPPWSRGLFAVSSDGKATEVDDPTDFTDTEHLFVDGDRLYFKASYDCPSGKFFNYVKTIFFMKSSSQQLPVNLRPDACSDPGDESGGDGSGSHPQDHHSSTLWKPEWGILFLGVAPMMAVAAWALTVKQQPGVFLNLFVGVPLIAVIIMQLSHFNSGEFVKWFLTLYALGFWIYILWTSIKLTRLTLFQEDLKSWAVVIASATFWLVLHWQLEIPWTEHIVPWYLYTLVIALQIGASFVVARSFPMFLSAISLFMIAWRTSDGVVDILGLQGEMQTLVQLMVLMLLGICIIVVAILYASRRHAVEVAVNDCTARLRGDAAVA